MSLHCSTTPDDSPRSLGHHSNDIDNPYVMSETSQVTDNDLPRLNRRSCTMVKHHHNDSIDALRDSPRSLEHSTDYVHHVYTVPETYKVSNFTTHNLSLPCDTMLKPYRSSVKFKPRRQPASHGWWPVESSDNESIRRMSFKTVQRGPRHKSDLGLSKGMPRPQMQYTNSNWWHAESEEGECTSHASSRPTSKSSQHEVHGDDPKRPSRPMGKPHSSASHTYDMLETHKVSNRPPVTKKMPKPS
jgi:hypothetical protein